MTSVRLELMLRAVKDFYADSISTLPVLFGENRVASIHFYAANMNPVRKQVCPSFLKMYQQWCDDGNLGTLQHWLVTSASHWAEVSEQVLVMSANDVSEAKIEQYIENNQL